MASQSGRKGLSTLGIGGLLGNDLRHAVAKLLHGLSCRQGKLAIVGIDDALVIFLKVALPKMHGAIPEAFFGARLQRIDEEAPSAKGSQHEIIFVLL